MKHLSIPMKFENMNEVINNNFHKVKLYVCHNGVNYNGSNFSDMAIAKASKTLQNVPILAYIERDNEGNATSFGGHEVEYQLEEKDGELTFKTFYKEVPIGVIPETNNYSIENIDGRNYVTCTGFIWKEYSNEAYPLLMENNNQQISMEIECKDTKFNDEGICDILDFEYMGVTVIGCEPAMEGAKIQMSFATNKNKEYLEVVKELNQYLKQFSRKEGENSMDNEKENIVEGAEFNLESQQEENFAEDEDKDGICDECGKPLDECTCEPENDEDDKDDNAKKKRKCSEDEEVEPKLYTQSDMDKAIADTKAEFANDMVELNNLREFKAEYDKQLEMAKLENDINEIVDKFSFSEDVISELKEKAMNKEITLEQFELNLFRMSYNKKDFSKKEEQSKQANIKIKDSTVEENPVDKLFKKYGLK